MIKNKFFAPAEKSKKKVINDLKKSGKYNEAFLVSVSKGLDKSSYFYNY